jgi:hypothetical protein
LDKDVVAWFRTQVENAGGDNYKTLINDTPRQHIARTREALEETLRRVIREEMKRAGWGRNGSRGHAGSLLGDLAEQAQQIQTQHLADPLLGVAFAKQRFPDLAVVADVPHPARRQWAAVEIRSERYVVVAH